MDYTDPEDTVRPTKPDPTIPEVNVDSVTFFAEVLENLNDEKKSSCILDTVVRVSYQGKVYGATFIGYLMDVMSKFGIINLPREDDISWTPTFNDLLSWMNTFMEKLKISDQKQEAA